MSIVVRPMMRRSVMLLPPALVSRRSHVQCLAVSGLVNVCRRDRAGAWQVPTPISPAGRLAALAPLSAVGDGRQGREPGIKSARRRETRAHFSTLVTRIRFAVSKSSTFPPILWQTPIFCGSVQTLAEAPPASPIRTAPPGWLVQAAHLDHAGSRGGRDRAPERLPLGPCPSGILRLALAVAARRPV